MSEPRTIVVIGGTRGIGLEIARRAAARGDSVVLSGRDGGRAERIAGEVREQTGGRVHGIGADLSEPAGVAACLSGIARVDHLILAAIDRDQNTVADFDVKRAIALVTLKLVGYAEAVHALLPALRAGGSIVLFGGDAKDRPYPGSTTVTTVNGGIAGLVRTLAVELAPIRVNAIHPGVVGDSPFWAGMPESVRAGHRARTPTGVLATMADVADATEFLMSNRSVNGVDLHVDGGWLLT